MDNLSSTVFNSNIMKIKKNSHTTAIKLQHKLTDPQTMRHIYKFYSL